MGSSWGKQGLAESQEWPLFAWVLIVTDLCPLPSVQDSTLRLWQYKTGEEVHCCQLSTICGPQATKPDQVCPWVPVLLLCSWSLALPNILVAFSLLSLGLELTKAVTTVWDFGKTVPEIHSCVLCEFLNCAKQWPKEAASNSSQI